MKLTKILALLLAVAMIFVMAAGCGGKKETPADNPSEAPTDTPAEQVTEPPAVDPADDPADIPDETEVSLPLVEETVSFRYLYPLQPFTMPYGLGQENMYNFQYMEEATNIHMELELLNFMQISESYNIIIASQDYPDFFGGFENYYTNGADEAIDQEIIIDLMPYINDELADYKAALNQDMDLWMYSLSPDGALASANYLMPGGEPSTAGLMIRSDWLEELGMEVPETYDEVYDYLVQTRDKFGGQGMMLQDVGFEGEFSLSGGYGASGYTSQNFTTHPFIQKDNVVEYSPVTEGYRSYLEMMNKWYSEGLIYPDFASVAWNEQMDIVGRGTIALWSSSYDAAATVQTNTEGAVNLRGMAQPTINAGDKVHLSKGVTKMIYGAAISTQCHDLKTALKWVNFCYTEKGALITGYGKEGVTYNMVDGKPEFTDLVVHNPDYALIVCVNIYTTYGSPAVVDGARYSAGWGRLDTEVIEAFGDPDRDWAYYIPSSYVKMSADVSAEFSSIMNDIATYVMQFAVRAIIGEVDIDSEWDAYAAKIDSMGLPEALGYEQAAWDSFLAKETYIPA